MTVVQNSRLEGIGCRWHEPRNILTDLVNPTGSGLDLALGVADLTTDGEEVVLMGGPQPLKAGDIGLQTRLLHQSFVTRGNCLGHGELVGRTLAEVFEAPDRCVAGKGGGDETGLTFVVLPHG